MRRKLAALATAGAALAALSLTGCSVNCPAGQHVTLTGWTEVITTNPITVTPVPIYGCGVN